MLLLPAFCLAGSPVLKESQSLLTNGARAYAYTEIAGQPYLALAQLAKDNPNSPAYMNGSNSNLPVLLYRYQENQFKPYQQIPSHGSEAVTFFKIKGQTYLAVASLRAGKKTPYDLHIPSVLYKWNGKQFKTKMQFKIFAAKGVTSFQIGQKTYLIFSCGVEPPNQKKRKHLS